MNVNLAVVSLFLLNLAYHMTRHRNSRFACHGPEFGTRIGPVPILRYWRLPHDVAAECRTGLAGKLTSRAVQRCPARLQRMPYVKVVIMQYADV